MKALTLLTFFTFLCTCTFGGLSNHVSAQTLDPKLDYSVTNIAFIKGKNGFLIDSITISTSLDTTPYGFPFPGDTLYFDLTIFDPYDELTIKTFADNHSFNPKSCWIEAPYANITLSIDAGRTKIDNITYSYVHQWYENKIAKLRKAKNLKYLKEELKWTGISQASNLMSVKFLETFFDMPNLTRADFQELKKRASEFFPTKILRHPWMKPMRQKIKLAGSKLPGPLNNYPLRSKTGETVLLNRPTTDYYVLNVYRYSDPKSQRQHEKIRKLYQQDSLFQFAPVVSVDTEESTALWRLYVNDGDFGWPHFLDAFTKGKSLVARLKYDRSPYYLLVNKKNQTEGIYDDLESLVRAIRYRQRLKPS